MLLLAVTMAPACACAQSLSDIFKKGSTITNVLEGVFSKSDLTVADLAGEWTSSGPAVCFKGDDLLKKAGGIAAAAAIESKLDPYYQKYGLNGAVITIDNDGNFTMSIKKMRLSGTVAAIESEKGTFDFNFTALGKVKIGSIKGYVQKTSNSIDFMFDATKLKDIMSAVANFSGISLAKTISSLLDSYDGLCVGFKCSLTGKAPATGNQNDKRQNIGNALDKILSAPEQSTRAGGNDTVVKGNLGSLRELLKNRNKE